MQITQEVRERYLASVLKNLEGEGFNYVSVFHEDGHLHGMTPSAAIAEALTGDVAHIQVTNSANRERKVGMLVINEPDGTPADMIADFGAANEEDMAVVQRCIDGGTSA